MAHLIATGTAVLSTGAAELAPGVRSYGQTSARKAAQPPLRGAGKWTRTPHNSLLELVAEEHNQMRMTFLNSPKVYAGNFVNLYIGPLNVSHTGHIQMLPITHHS